MVLEAGDSHNEGRVKVYYDGKWGTVCDDSWDIRDARVVCRELGFQDAENFFPKAYFGEGTGQIWMNQVDCVGNEPSLLSCRHNTSRDRSCSHKQDAGVRCKLSLRSEGENM